MGEQKQGWPEARWPAPGWPEARWLEAGWPGQRWPWGPRTEANWLGVPHVAREPQGQEILLCSEDLYRWREGGEEVTYWLTGESGDTFPRELWLPNCRYVWGSVNPNTYLALQSLCSFCMYNRKQGVDPSCFVGFCGGGTVDHTPFSLPDLGMNTQSQDFPFPSQWRWCTQTFKRQPPALALHYHSFASSLKCLAVLWTTAQDCCVNGCYMFLCF